MHPTPPNISRSTVIGCESKYKLSKKHLKEEFCPKERFLVKKRGHICYISDFRPAETDKRHRK